MVSTSGYGGRGMGGTLTTLQYFVIEDEGEGDCEGDGKGNTVMVTMKTTKREVW